MSQARILLYEPESVGHRRIYLSAFLESWFHYGNASELVCALHPDLIRHCESLPTEWRPKAVIAVSGNGTSAPQRFREAKALAQQYSCTEVFLLYGDSYLFAVLRECPQLALKISLLLFRYEVDAAARFPLNVAGIKEIVRQGLKTLLVRFALDCGSVNKCLFLDPWVVAGFRRTYPGRICFVPEPVRGNIASKRQESATGGGPLKLLLLGTVDVRKGLEEVCAALELLPRGNRVALQIVGRVLPDYQPKYESLIARIKSLSHVDLQLKNSPFREEEIPAILAEADVVAVLYGARHTGMSSVFAWATVCRKPVLTVDWGVIGFATKAFGLGYVSRSLAASDLACALAAASGRGYEVVSADRFLRIMDEFAPAKFLRDYFVPALPRSGCGPDMRQEVFNVY